MAHQYKVIVLGLGAMGSAAVYQLAKRGVQVLGIDRYNPPHNLGSTHGESRITRQAIGEGPHYTPLSLRSYEIFREIEKCTGEELLKVTGGLMISSERRTGSVHVENFFAQTLAAAQKYGIEHEMLDARQMRTKFPQFKVKDDELAYYEPEAGYLRPEVCVRTQLALARDHGAEIHTNERVIEIAEKASNTELRTETGETYECEQLIVSAGPWLTELLGRDCPDIFTITRQRLFWFDIEDCFAQFQAPTFPVFIWEPQGAECLYGFPAIAGPKGGMKIATATYMERTTPDLTDRVVSSEEMRNMYELQIKPNFPQVGKCIESDICLYTCTEDSGFIIDRLPSRPRTIICSACSGHGFKHSAAIGETLALLATGSTPAIDISNCALKV
ncbi:MAG TPA: N-methyl-L-tryptophan oxidase [Planktothrix sp.]